MLDEPRPNPWETNWTFNIILIVTGGFASLLLLWLIMCWLFRCCKNCCGNGKYVPPEQVVNSTKVAPSLHRIATCEESLSELKLAKAKSTSAFQEHSSKSSKEHSSKSSVPRLLAARRGTK